ncbi:MAG: PIG-L family deacetylase [Acidimicrobiia bacterium]|nr:PIG-L family deacetylase [Acidimicrobiia bacterium]
MSDAVVEMREWGLVAPDELARIVVVSPHLDDAVLGCGRLLSCHPGATVVTLFAGGPAEYSQTPTRWDGLAGFKAGDDVLALRREEDRRALNELGASPVWLDFVEHQYLDRADWITASATVDVLEASIRAAQPTAVFAPFGLGNPDHDVTHVAAMAVRDRMLDISWFCYEDMGYKHIPGLLAWRVSQLFRANLWPTPAVVPIDASGDLRAKALAHYVSQLRALEADWKIDEKLDAPEQHWRMDPPPDGWEALSAL